MRSILVGLAFAIPCLASSAPTQRLATMAESSGWLRTGRHEEANRLCAEFAKAYPGRARSLTFGTTPEGRAMMALVVSGDGALTPAACKRRATARAGSRA